MSPSPAERARCADWLDDELRIIRELLGESIVITSNADGRVKAFYNVCRHRGTRICTEAPEYVRTISQPPRRSHQRHLQVLP